MRILVTAASRHGSTAEIATELGKALRGNLPGVGVDVVPLSRIAGVDGYDAVVLGSAVYFGRWLDEARWQVGAQAATLRERPVWLFSSGPVGDPAVPADEPVDGAELAAAIGAREHVVFPGALHREFLGVRERVAVGLVHAPDGDYRDWPAVRAWADRIAAALRVSSGLG
ncbi:MAG TPA: flavodoxin domain-containing protein [Mycobacteriales bacterium]